MRRFLGWSVLALVVVLVALPATLGRLTNKHMPTAQPGEASRPAVGGDSLATVKVYFPGSHKVEDLDLAEYLKGVVAAEMPPEFADEALKAQFVVARTFAVRRMHQFWGKGGCSLEASADVCADPGTGQAYMSKEDLQKKMGAETAAAFWTRLDRFEAETDGEVLKYDGVLIDALYHSVSGTKTEDAGAYYGQSLPYLKSVDDHWGAEAPKLKETERFTPDELARRLSTGGKSLAVPALASMVKAGSDPVQIAALTDSGRVKTVKILGLSLSGREFREKLALPSTNFTVSVQNGAFVINTIGNGHGVGMSQYGADGMARAGKSYRDILTHYYTDITISPMFEG